MDKNRKSYTSEEVEKASLEYFKGDELAASVWKKKYCLKDSQKFYELTPDDMHHRLAKEFARIEAKYSNGLTEDEIYETLKNFERIVPGGSPMSGIGNDFQVVSISNCFVEGTNVFTLDGIKKIEEVKIGTAATKRRLRRRL